MTTDTAVRNPYQERDQLRADVRRAREAHDKLRADSVRLQAERKLAEADAFREEMEAVLGDKAAAERRDAALERMRTAETGIQEKQRGMDAAGQVLQVRHAQLAELYDSDEGFSAFVKEAESATAGAVSDLQELRVLLARAGGSWGKATGLWSALNAALRHRIEQLDEREGRIGNPPSEAVVPVFPISLPSGLDTAAPRPPGVNRLRAAEDDR